MNRAGSNEAEIFDMVRRIDSREGRRRCIQQTCGHAQELQARIEALMRVYEEEAGFLESPPEGLQSVRKTPIRDIVGEEIGPYQLIERIGEGGFGVVFMAEQTHPMRRTVALKILKPGMDTRQVIARFEAERQALALMDHPNIAKVLDAGTTGPGEGISGSDWERRTSVSDTYRPPGSERGSLMRELGRPYFVMELVNGIPITLYCDEHRLTPRERLTLFIPVCRAVQHAHQKGIIHRDLKPSNVMVAEYDGRAVPKVIDFGVAKALVIS